MSKYDTILFDLDGTLWDASIASASGWNSALKALDISEVNVSPQDIRKVSGKTFIECIKALFSDISAIDSTDLIQAIDSYEKSSVVACGGKLYPGVTEGLKYLASHYELFLASNCQDWYLDAFWKHASVIELFRASDCHGKSGIPKSEMIERIIKQFACEDPIYVGDTSGDEKAAYSAKVDFAFVTYGFGEATNPNAVFQSFEDLIAWF